MIIWYAFFPSLLTTLSGILYLGYQFFAFKSSPIFENWPRSFGYVLFTTVVDVLKNNVTTIVPLIVFIVIVVVLWLLVPSICEGSIIQLIARKKNGHDVKTRDGMRYGFMSFLPIFEYSWVIRSFSIVSVLGLMSSILRNFGWEPFYTFLPVVILFIIACVIVTLLFTYSEFFIVIDDRKVFDSIAKSCVLVMSHLEETLLLSILMLIISIRILIQILFVILIPAIIMGSIYLFAATTFAYVGIIVGGVLGLALLYIASYLSGTIHVFAASVWTFTFLKLTAEQEVSARTKVED
jgi:hypothetical protein